VAEDGDGLGIASDRLTGGRGARTLSWSRDNSCGKGCTYCTPCRPCLGCRLLKYRYLEGRRHTPFFAYATTIQQAGGRKTGDLGDLAFWLILSAMASLGDA